jgi:hypothetical protein
VKHERKIYPTWRNRLLVMAGHDAPDAFIVDFQRRLQKPGNVAIQLDHDIYSCDGSCLAGVGECSNSTT